MYESFFGLTGVPFLLNPDPSFLFDSKGHRDTLAALQRGFDASVRLMVVTGDVGAGKTTLLQAFLENVDRAAISIVHVSAARLDADVLSERLSTALRLPWVPNERGRREALLAWLRAGQQPLLLVIDEAQHLASGAFDLLRAMATAAGGAATHLQICLVGQPELRILLNGAERADFREQIDVDRHLGPLGESETRQYIEHRLRTVGWSGRPAFDDAALFEIFVLTSGIPRRINLLCNSLLLSACLMKKQRIDAAAVTRAAAAMRGDSLDSMPDLLQSGSDFDSPAAPPKVAEHGVLPIAERDVGLPCWKWQGSLPEPDSAKTGAAIERGPLAPLPIFWEDSPNRETAVRAPSEGAAGVTAGLGHASDLLGSELDLPSDAPSLSDSSSMSGDAPADSAAHHSTGPLGADDGRSTAPGSVAPTQPINPRLPSLGREGDAAPHRRHFGLVGGAAVFAVALAVVFGFALRQRSASTPPSYGEFRTDARDTVTPAMAPAVRGARPPSKASSTPLVTPDPTLSTPSADPQLSADMTPSAALGIAPDSHAVHAPPTEAVPAAGTPSSGLRSPEPVRSKAGPPAPATLGEGNAATGPIRRASRAVRQTSKSFDDAPTRIAPVSGAAPVPCTANAAMLALC